MTQSSAGLNEKMNKLPPSWKSCVNWVQHKYISRKAKNLVNSIAGSSKDGDGELSLDRLHETTAEGGGWVKEIEEKLELQKETCDDIMKQLIVENETRMIIGVYGMAGVGKTILIHQLAKKVKEELSFEVVMAAGTPSSNPSLSKKQEEEINGWLKEGKKVLVVLDSIWKPITSLKDIGIPYPFDKEHGGCLTVVVATRNHGVLPAKDTRESFLIGPLPEDKASALLRHIGIYDDNESYTQILRKCEGLPLALVEVASRIVQINKTGEPKDSVHLRLNELPDSVYLRLNPSFLYLDNDELMHTFLLCSLFGNNEISYKQIVKYAVGERDPDDLVNLNMKDERSRVLRNMEILQKSSLLQDRKANPSAVMHPIIFHFAKIVASMNHMFVSSSSNEKNGSEQLLHHLNKDEQRNMTHISLLSGAIDETQFGDFRKLKFLYVGANASGKSSILKKNLEKLRVLDHVGKPIFDSIIYDLKYIQTLCLNDSEELEAEEIVKVANLKSLKILSFTGNTVIHQLPNEIGNLTSLCVLELRCKVQKIPPNVLSKLNQLQELYITDFNDWAEFETDHNISLPEVGRLQRLSVLDIVLPSPSLRFLEITSNVS